MENLKNLVQRIINDTNRRNGATDVQHSLMVDLDNINKHANELLTLIEASDGETSEREQANDIIPLVINWVAFKDGYPPNNTYVLVVDDREQQKVIFIHNSTLDIDANMHLYTHWMHLPKPPCL